MSSMLDFAARHNIAPQVEHFPRSKVNDAIGNIDITDPTSDLNRFEEKVRREEAKVLGQQELQSSSLDAQFESLEDVGRDAEVEARLAALKNGGSSSI